MNWLSYNRRRSLLNFLISTFTLRLSFEKFNTYESKMNFLFHFCDLYLILKKSLWIN